MKKTTDNLVKSQDVIGLAVFSVAEGQKLGAIKDIFLEPGKKSPLFLVEDEEWYKGGKVLKGGDIMKIGQDALVIESKDKMEHFSKVSNIELMLRMNTDLTSILVINSAQEELGKINGYFIDREKIEVVSLEVKNETDEPVYWPAEKISSFKDGAVVVLGEEQVEEESRVESPAYDQASADKRESKEKEQENEQAAEPEGLIKEESRVESQESKEEKKEEKPAEEAKGASKQELKEEKVATGNGEAKEEARGESRESREEVKDAAKELKAEEAEVTEASVAHKDLKQILEERQDKFLLAKKVDRDITADDGTIIIKKGETITKEVLEEAKKAHKYIVLSFCVKTDLIKKS